MSPVFVTVQTVLKDAPGETLVESGGACLTNLHDQVAFDVVTPAIPSVGAAVGNLNIKVGVGLGVTLAVGVGKGVEEGVIVGGIRACVCVAAAAAVCATMVFTMPGMGVGIC